MEWLSSYFKVVLVIGLLGAIWLGFQVGFGKLLEWLMTKLGFSGFKNVVLSERNMVGTVLEPFKQNHQGNILKGKVLYHGEIWNAYCNAELANIIKKDDKVEVIRNKDLSVNVQKKIID